MAILGQSLDYTDRDFESLRLRLRSLIVSVFPTWTDDAVANTANLLVELYANVGDVLGFYQDNQARESRITTARQRKNILAACKLLGYKPSGPRAAEATELFTLSAPVPSGRTVTLYPAFHAHSGNNVTVATEDTDNPQEFELVDVVTIAAGQTSATGTVRNSTKQVETFVSNGRPFQTITLSGKPFLDDSSVVTDDGSGTTPWTEKNNLLSSTDVDRHYTVSVDENDQATISFGNGKAGVVPVGTIRVVYETGGGAAGRAPAGAITKINGSFIDSAGADVTVSVTNPERAILGDDRQTIESIKEIAPESIRANDRAICKEDFESFAREVDRGGRFLMLTRKQDQTINYGNQGKLYAVPTGIGFPTLATKNAILKKITQDHPTMLTFEPEVVDPIYVDIGIAAKVYLTKGAKPDVVRAAILKEIVQFFSLKNADGTVNTDIDFGWNLRENSQGSVSEIAISKLGALIQNVPGVREVGDQAGDFNLIAYRVVAATDGYNSGATPAELVQGWSRVDVPIQVREFPRLKMATWGGSSPDITLVNGDTGAAL